MEDNEMKKVYILLFAAVALAVSCQVEPQTDVEEQTPAEVEMMVEKDFTVSMPGSDTKTALAGDGHTVNWVSGDKINVIAATSGNQYTYTLKSGEGTPTAVFTGSMSVSDAADTKFYAVYPDVNVTIGDDSITFASSSNGDHRKYFSSGTKVKAIAGGFDPDFAPMFAVSSDESFTFKHGAAFFKLKVSADGVKTVRLYAGGGARFDGRPTYKPSTGATTNVESAQRFVDVQPEVGTFDTSETYYIPVLTKASSVGDLTLTYTLSDGTTSASKTSSSLSSKTLVSGKIYNLGTPAISFDPEIVPVAPGKLEADATNGSFTYTVSNPDGVSSVTASLTSGDWVSNVSATGGDSGTVTFDCEANTGAERTATITLLYTGADNVVVTITQKAGGGAVVDTYLLYVTEGNVVTQTKNGESTSYFSSVGSKLSCDGTSSNFGVSSFNIKGESHSKAVKVDGSNTPTFTTSTGVSVTVKFYCAGRVSSATPLNLTESGESTPVVSADLTWTDGKADLYESAVIDLKPGTTYTFTRGTGNIGLFYVEVIETKL